MTLSERFEYQILGPKMYFFLFAVFFVAFSLSSQELRVATYNLRYDNPGDSLNNWQYRKNTVAKLIRFHDFDIFGTQEGLKHQLDYLEEQMPGYTYIGVGRDDGKEAGEYTAIFYKKAQFELLDKGNFWLSEDTTKPNKGWDAALPRICSWGKFKEKSSGLIFFFFNTHFDHIGTIARKESSKLILRKIEEIAGNNPTLLTGDFNVDQQSPSYDVLENSDYLSDAYDTAGLRYGADGTFNRFKVNSRTESRIDHIFTTKDFEVVKHAILTDTYQTDMKDLKRLENSGTYPQNISLFENQARLPSDHYPVIAVLKL
ncbi:endonuclease/exonuclease/phosphatase family protein [Flavobacteriaceae bacterium F89]|uniref:Endonuclease/exonuclease/phosphatase family protein n=1 Tax=Cerina litoralis TaxID=2874477 RepID=A0AAE3ETK8_9FLAO|nr:endonuclease/exonuclease/phosphatase family protein [Cerina litoralis]MCG2460842.1 endonuclease/exonuclease/phosphatase family protein [Cerina litoralis]